MDLRRAAIGIAAAQVSLNQLASYPEPFDVPLYQRLELDYRTILFVAGLSALIAIVLGVVPPAWVSRRTSSSGLRVTDSSGRRRWVFRKTLLIGQVTLSFVILMGTVVLGTSVYRLLIADLGFVTENVVLLSVDASRASQSGDASRTLVRLADALRAQPGISTVSLGDPPLGNLRATVRLSTTDGRVDKLPVLYRSVERDYFAALGIQVLRGREFGDSRAETSREVIVNESLAGRVWPGRDPLGAELRVDGEAAGRRVVGVVRTVAYSDVWESPQPSAYLPVTRRPVTTATLIIRGAGSIARLEPILRREVSRVSPDVAILKVDTMTGHLRSQLSRQRLATTVLGVLSAITLVLMVVGVFGLTSFVARQRTKDLGIRIALGIQTRALLVNTLAETGLLSAIGITLGAVAWWSLSMAFEPEAHFVDPRDLRLLLLTGATVMALTWLAAYWPARRASATSPLIALRSD